MVFCLHPNVCQFDTPILHQTWSSFNTLISFYQLKLAVRRGKGSVEEEERQKEKDHGMLYSQIIEYYLNKIAAHF